ncbi:hypothetical protein JCM13210_16950 [Thermaerobacter litoralis]
MTRARPGDHADDVAAQLARPFFQRRQRLCRNGRCRHVHRLLRPRAAERRPVRESGVDAANFPYNLPLGYTNGTAREAMRYP